MKRLRKIISFLLALVMILGLLPVPAGNVAQVYAADSTDASKSGNCGVDITWELTQDTEADWDLSDGTPYKLTITGSGEMGYEGGNAPWYADRATITSISISEGITKIAEGAFCQCVSLKSVTIPDSVEELSSRAFSGCKLLESVICGSGLKKIGNNAFSGNSSLKSVTLQEGLEVLGTGAFFECKQLSEISLPESVTTLQLACFGRTALKELVIPKNVNKISGRIAEYTRLDSIRVAEENPYYKAVDHVLYEQREDGSTYKAIDAAIGALSNTLTIADGTEIIGKSAFEGIYGISYVVFPDTLKTIESKAFYSGGIREAAIPDSVEEIGKNAFAACPYLTSAAIGKGLRKLSDGVFYGAKLLSVITIASENPYFDAVENVLYDKEHTVLYLYAPAKPDTVYHLPETAETLMEYSICSVSALEELYMSEKVRDISGSVIYGNKKLKAIYFPGDDPMLGVAESRLPGIKNNAENLIIFRSESSNGWDEGRWGAYVLANWRPGAPSWEEGTFEGISWKYEGDRGRITFTGAGKIPDFTEEEPAPWESYMDLIQTIEMEEGITEIGNRSFSNAKSLLRLEASPDLQRVGDYAFSDCIKLVYSDMASPESIGAAAFLNDSAIRDDIALDRVSMIGAAAFKGCSAVGSVYLGVRLTALEEEVFSGCTGLNSAIIPESVTSIKKGAFRDCKNLRTVNIPAGVDTIQTQAFAGGASLEKVYFYGTVPANWEADCFADCNAALTLAYRKTQTDWERLNGSWNGYPLLGLERFYTEQKDHYSFRNTRDSFGYSSDYRIPRQQYVDALHDIINGTYYYVTDGSWGGSCYGMVSTTLEFYENAKFNIKNYDASAQDLYHVAAPGNKSAKLTKLIETYQVSQYHPAVAGSGGDIGRHMKDYKGLIRKVEEFERSGGLRTDEQAGPVVMLLYSLFGGHAVIPVSVDQAENGDFLMKVYDPNKPDTLQTLTIYKDFGGISYGSYRYASYADYTTIAAAMSDEQLYADAQDRSLYLSIDKENGKVIHSNGKGIDEIEGAYEQKPFNGEEDVFSGLKRFVLPKGSYKLTAEEGEETAQAPEAAVTFYMASKESFAQITSSDENAVLEIRESSGETDGLTISVQSESTGGETAEVTLMNPQGIERTIEVEGSCVDVTVGENDSIAVRVPEEERVLIDGRQVEMSEGKAEASFTVAPTENPLKVKRLESSIRCDEKNQLSGTADALVAFNAQESGEADVRVEYLFGEETVAASYSQRVQLNPGWNEVALSFETIETVLEGAEGEVPLSCRLTVTDKNGNSAASMLEGLKVSVQKEPEKPGTTEPENPGTTEPANPTNPGTINKPLNPPTNTKIGVTKVKVSKANVVLGVGETYQLNVSVLPKNASNKKLTYKASNNKVKVNSKGKVTAKKTGVSKITVKSSNGKKTVVKITVKKAPKKISLNAKKKTLKAGKSFQIKVKLPKGTASNKISYQSSKKSVVSVSAAGKIKAKKKGSATITVKTFNGKKAKLRVIVK